MVAPTLSTKPFDDVRIDPKGKQRFRASNDNAYLVVAFGMDDGNDRIRKHAESNVTCLAIVFARVFGRNERTREDAGCVTKVYAVLRKVDLSLLVVPRDIS